MANTIAELKAAIGAGARVAKFKITMPTVTGAPGVSFPGATLLCKSASLPDVRLGTTDVWMQGRKLPIPGDTEYTNNWTLDFYNTLTHDLRNDFVKWMVAIDDFHKNVRKCSIADVMVDLVVSQLGCDGEITAEYTLHNCFPSDVAEVTLDASQINQIQEFRVTFTYSSWEKTA